MVLVTADHGNADDMWMRDKAGRPRQAGDGDVLPRTSHTLAPVPFTLFDPRPSPPWKLRGDLPQAGLANVAATALLLLGFAPPPHMEEPLIEPA